jgi:hypothetical protein
MSSEIIQSVAYDNYDDFQHVNLIFSQNCKKYPHICTSSYTFIRGVAKKNKGLNLRSNREEGMDYQVAPFYSS